MEEKCNIVKGKVFHHELQKEKNCGIWSRKNGSRNFICVIQSRVLCSWARHQSRGGTQFSQADKLTGVMEFFTYAVIEIIKKF